MKKDSITIGVTDMMCSHCEASVEKALAALGVKAKADHVAKIVTVQYNAAKVTVEDIKEAIREAGFTLA